MTFNLATIAHELGKRKARCGNVRIVTVDGKAGSGKTTFASHLSHVLNDCPVVSMDSLYNGWDHALEDETFTRIIEQILNPLKLTGCANYQTYDWHEKMFAKTTSITNAETVIIEGVGSGHPKLSSFVSLAIWIEADERSLLSRVLQRDGDEIREDMLRWQKKEITFFKQFKIKESADYIIQAQ